MSFNRSKALTKIATIAICVILAVVVIVGVYVDLNLNKGAWVRITCGNSPTELTLTENGTTTVESYRIPTLPCRHAISLSSFSLIATGAQIQNYLSGYVYINTTSPLAKLLLFVNNTFESERSYSNNFTTPYAIQYKAGLSNAILPIISGRAYVIEFLAVFQDDSASYTAAVITANRSNNDTSVSTTIQDSSTCTISAEATGFYLHVVSDESSTPIQGAKLTVTPISTCMGSGPYMILSNSESSYVSNSSGWAAVDMSQLQVGSGNYYLIFEVKFSNATLTFTKSFNVSWRPESSTIVTLSLPSGNVSVSYEYGLP